MPKKLPRPDMFGNYWFGPKPHGAAIFALKDSDHVHLTGQYIVSLGEKGMVWQGANLRRFKYIQEAVDVLGELG
jgi:hypothetical protein